MITKVEHTSAPWTVRETETAIQIRAEREFISVAEMSKQVIGDDGEAYQAAMADARLIAAAPEVLEVLELLHRLTLQTPSLANDPDSREVMDRAWTVIHKTRGDV